MNDSLLALKGIGKKKYSGFQKMGLHTVEQLLFYYPREYEDRAHISALSTITESAKYAVRIRVVDYQKFRRSGGKTMHKFVVADDSATAQVIFINTPFITNYFHLDGHYFLYGQINVQVDGLVMFHPEIRPHSDGGFGIVPKYSLSEGVTNKDIRKALLQCTDYITAVKEVLPQAVILKNKLLSRSRALNIIHFPTDLTELQQARYRLKYEELFNLQMAMLYKRSRIKKSLKQCVSRKTSGAEIKALFQFELTGDQQRAIDDILDDMASTTPMNRLLQGDVGSGKTAVAITATYTAVKNGFQVALMAPTEILARQHYETFAKFFEKEKIALLTSSASGKKEMCDAIAAGEIDIVIGTHAIIQTAVAFNKLALVITDEQHRFGVNQRKLLSEKAEGVDVLVMSATPIPRTLSLIVYGDMDISTINEMPIGRLPVKTHYVKPPKYHAMLDYIEEHLASGEQVYFVAPLIEESDKIDLIPAEKLYQSVAARFVDYQVALVHGRMTAEQKNETMVAFKNGDIQVLVSTTVIEVGVDVPQATIIVITHSERFGLAQLHQLRGRVGRGKLQSYCFLLAKQPGKIARQRIAMMTKTNDGFAIANKDLEIRGPGEMLGIKQHGLPELKIVNLKEDIDLLKVVQADCKQLFSSGEDIIDYLDWLNTQMIL